MLNKKGFTIIEILLVILVLTAVAGVGLYAYNTVGKKDDSKPTSETTNSQKSSNDQVSDSKSELFKFTELGVGIKISSQLEGLSYSVDPQDNSTLLVTTSKFQQEGSGCKEAFALIYKMNGTFSEKSSTLLKQFGSYYIASLMPACVDSDTAPQLQMALAEAFKTAEEI